jgi:hypothetical protein
MIVLTVIATVWYFGSTGEWAHFRLRSLLVLTTSIAIIVATAELVPASMLGAWSGIAAERIEVEVVERVKNEPINNAEVTLISQCANVATTQMSTTNEHGSAQFTAECVHSTRKSILRVWTTYHTGGWSLKANVARFRPINKVLSDIVVEGEGEGEGLISFHIALERE